MQEGPVQTKSYVKTYASDLVQRWLGRLGVYQKRRFVILGLGRSGSGFLCRMLDLQEDIVCTGEIFHRDGIYFNNYEKIEKFVDRSFEYRVKHPKEFLWRFWTYDTGACLGFKIFLTHDPKAIAELLADRSVKKIILSRRNRVKRYVSQAVAERTDCWIKFENEPTEQVQVTIDPKAMLQNVRTNNRRYEDIRQRLVSSNQEFKEVYYEDLVGERKIEYLTSVAEYLGCRNIDRTRWHEDATHKQNSDKLEDLVENYEELKVALVGTDLEQFLD